jgi:hypothetical protein
MTITKLTVYCTHPQYEMIFKLIHSKPGTNWEYSIIAVATPDELTNIADTVRNGDFVAEIHRAARSVDCTMKIVLYVTQLQYDNLSILMDKTWGHQTNSWPLITIDIGMTDELRELRNKTPNWDSEKIVRDIDQQRLNEIRDMRKDKRFDNPEWDAEKVIKDIDERRLSEIKNLS